MAKGSPLRPHSPPRAAGTTWSCWQKESRAITPKGSALPDENQTFPSRSPCRALGDLERHPRWGSQPPEATNQMERRHEQLQRSAVPGGLPAPGRSQLPCGDRMVPWPWDTVTPMKGE